MVAGSKGAKTKDVRPGYLDMGDYRLRLELVKINNQIAEPNRSYVLAYKKALELNNRKTLTMYRRLSELKDCMKMLGGKDAKKVTRKDIEELVLKINKRPIATISKGKTKLTLKTFYKWIEYDRLDKSDPYPELVRWIKIDTAKTRKLPDELLTEEDVLALINQCRSPRDKAFIALLWDTGARIGEIINLRIRDVKLSDSELSRVMLNGKTGQRRTPIVFSVPYIVTLLNSRPRVSEAQLFITKDGRPLDYPIIRKILGELKERASIHKRIHPHLFRHSRATFYAGMLTEQQMKEYFGWVGDSKMVGTYTHMSGRDVDNAIIRANGLSTADGKIKEPAKPLTIKTCIKCKEVNPVTNQHCQRCGTPLDANVIREFNEMEELRKEVKDLRDIVDLAIHNKEGSKRVRSGDS